MRNVLRWKNEFSADLFFAIGEVYFLDTGQEATASQLINVIVK